MPPSDSPASGSPLSDIDSDEFSEDPKFPRRSRSHSRNSTLSAASSPTLSADASASHRAGRASKRRRTGASTYEGRATPLSAAYPPASPTADADGDISSDTSGSVPTSPSFAHLGPTHPLSTAYAAAQANPDDPEMADYTQVTRCLWEGCPQPEQANMDNLVNHIHDVHIGLRQKKYSCEWQGCSRKGMPHASGYALRAHMRSHTKEKPFFCSLPECDRSFTRSDALAKHMRTVHETEALRPSDPIPRGHTGGISNGGANALGMVKRLRLVMAGDGGKGKSVVSELPPLPRKRQGSSSSLIKKEDDDSKGEAGSVNGNGDKDSTAVDIDTLPFTLPVPDNYYPADVTEAMDEHERKLPPSQYFRLLRRQIHWAEQESKRLAKALEDERSKVENSDGQLVKAGAGDEAAADRHRRAAWKQTEAILDDIVRLEAERVWNALGAGKKGRRGTATAPATHAAQTANDDDNKERGKDSSKRPKPSASEPWQMVKGLDELVGELR